MKKIISFILMTVVVGTALSGCSNLSAGSKDGSNIDSQTKETSELKSANDSSPAESSTSPKTENSKPTEGELKEKAKTLIDDCIQRVKEKGITDEEHLKQCTVSLLVTLMRECPSNWTDDELIDYFADYVYSSCVAESVKEKYLEKHENELPSNFSDKNSIYLKVFRLRMTFPDLSEEKYLEMLEIPIKNYPDYAFDFDYYFPMQEAKIAGIVFDESKRITENDFKEIMDMVESIDDAIESSSIIRQELYKRQAYPDVVHESSTFLLYFSESADFEESSIYVSAFSPFDWCYYPINWYNFNYISFRKR